MIIASWKDILGQAEAVNKLKHFISSGKLNHAYLFMGPQSVGKHTTAKVLACAINCEAKGCGKCSCCVKITRETHPDVIQVAPEGNFITIGQIREVQREVSRKPFEMDSKVYIIDEVEKMTAEAANALLKVLEEPPDGVVFILITSNLEGVLPTIVSRCYQIYFRPIAIDVIIDEIVRRYEVDKDRAELVAKISRGIFGNAIEMLNSERRLKRREFVLCLAEKLKRLDALGLANEANCLTSEVGNYIGELKLKQEIELVEVEEIVANRAHAARFKKRLIEKQKRERGKEEFRAFEDILDIFSSWYRDVLIITGCLNEDLLMNTDCVEKIRIFGKGFSLQKAQGALEIIQETKRMLRFNINRQLALEVMLFKLQEAV